MELFIVFSREALQVRSYVDGRGIGHPFFMYVDAMELFYVHRSRLSYTVTPHKSGLFNLHIMVWD